MGSFGIETKMFTYRNIDRKKGIKKLVELILCSEQYIVPLGKVDVSICPQKQTRNRQTETLILF